MVVLEQRTNHFEVLEARTRANMNPFEGTVTQALSFPNQTTVLSKSTRLSPGAPELLGVLYGSDGVMFSRIDANTVLAISAEPSGFDEALQIVNQALPRLLRNRPFRLASTSEPISAADATEIARRYLTALVECSDVTIDSAILRSDSRSWEIEGTFRSMPLAPSRRFIIQLHSITGAVVGYSSTPKQSLAPVITGICVIILALFFVVWLLFLIG